MMRDASQTLSSRALRHCALGLILAAGLWGPVAADASVDPEIPGELRRAVSADLRRIEAAGANGYRALNPENRMTLNFDGRSVQLAPTGKDRHWHWGLELAGYGTPGHQRAVQPAQVAVSGQRLEYRRGEVTEWYENRPEGVEQGFTLAKPPVAGATEIELRMSASGGLKAEIEAGGHSAKLSDGAGHAVLSYRDLSVVDAQGKVLPAHLALAGDQLAIEVETRDAVWPIVVDPVIFNEQAMLTAADPMAGTLFGRSVAISGNTAVVGAPDRDNLLLPHVGAAYVFVRPAGGAVWVQQAFLYASDGAADDRFGQSVAISGDTVVVGAADAGLNAEGAAYVFVKPAGGWVNTSETAKLTASDAAMFDFLGGSVAIFGDTVVVGAVLSDGVSPDSGSAYVFVKPLGGWVNGTETAKLFASDGTGSSTFGRSVAVAEGTVVVGAPQVKVPGVGMVGAVYVFSKPGGGWVDGTETAKLTASDALSGDLLGYSVAVSGDTVAAGAGSAGFVGKGAVYVYVKSGPSWSDSAETAKLTASDGSEGDHLGVSVAMDGNLVVAGAPLKDAPFGNMGAAYLYVKPAGGWVNGTETQKLVASDGSMSDQSGRAVAVSGNTVLVGVPWADVSGEQDAGAAYVYAAPGEVLTVTKTGTGSGKVTSDPAGIDCGAVCQASYPKDTVVTLTAKASPGSIFLGWGSSCGYQPIGAPVLPLNQCQIKLNKAKTVKAKFVKVLP